MATKAQTAKSKRPPKFSTRVVRRCELTGRAKGVYRKFRISRIMLPARNRKELEDIPQPARDQLRFVWLEKVEDAIGAAIGGP